MPGVWGAGMRVGSLFAGYGGSDLAVQSIWPDAHPAWFVEYDKHPSAILAHHWPGVAFVEWMMGLPAGWVTDSGIPRSAQLKALGNGIVWQQMALALRLLLDDEVAA